MFTPCSGVYYSVHVCIGMPSEIANVSVSVELIVLIFYFHDANSTAAPCPNVITKSLYVLSCCRKNCMCTILVPVNITTLIGP